MIAKKLFWVFTILAIANVRGAAQEEPFMFRLQNDFTEDVYYMHARSYVLIGQQSEKLLKKKESTIVKLPPLRCEAFYTLRLYPASALKTESAEIQEAMRTDYNIPPSVLCTMNKETFKIENKDGRAIIPQLDKLLEKHKLGRTTLIDALVKKEMEPYKD